MRSLYGVFRRVWHTLPHWFHGFVEWSPPLNALRGWLSDATIKRASHEEIYDAEYYRVVDSTASPSAKTIARFLVERFHPTSVLDVGCGTGALLYELVTMGVQGSGLEYSQAGLEWCRRRDLKVRQFNLETDQPAEPIHVDVVISMEVAEHLPASCAERYLDLLCGAGDRIIFTAATPGQGGSDHVNEQPHEYWISKFVARGFSHEVEASNEASKQWEAAGIATWYWRNVMIFARQRLG